VSHWLVIHEQGEDYTIEHDADCPQEKGWDGPDGEPIMMHTCLLGALVHEAGIDHLDWRSLPVGRYEIEAWAEHYPSTPYRPAEWDAGINLVEEAK
jgi:hypothetical protein